MIGDKLEAAALSSAERSQLLAELGANEQVLYDEDSSALILLILRSIGPEQFSLLRERGELQLSSVDATLPPVLDDRLWVHAASISRGHPAPPGPNDRQLRLLLRLHDAPRMEAAWLGPRSWQDRRLRLEVRLEGDTREGSSMDGFRYRWETPRHTRVRQDQTSHEASLLRPVELHLRVPGASDESHRNVRWQPSVVAGHPAALDRAGVLWPKWVTVGRLSTELHRTTGLEVVADGFVGARIDPALLRGPQPVLRILNTLARELDYDWTLDGKTLFLRNRQYYRDRTSRVPETVLRPWRDRVRQRGQVTLDDLADLAVRLTDRQLAELEDYWGWYLEGSGIRTPGWLYAYRQHLRFWATLTPAQRTLARSEVLPLDRLTPFQRQAWGTGLLSPPETNDASFGFIPRLMPDEWSRCGFSLRSAALVQQLYLADREDGSAEGTTVTASPSVAPGAPSTVTDASGGHSHGPRVRLDTYVLRYHMPTPEDCVRASRIMVARLDP